MDWHLLCMGCINLLPALYPLAFGHLSLRVTKTAEKQNDNDAQTHQHLAQDFDWHELEGRRSKAYCERMSGPAREETVTMLTVQAIVLEPCRFLTKRFLRKSSSSSRALAQRRGRAPPLCDLAWGEGSPAIRCMQYLSALLVGDAPRPMKFIISLPCTRGVGVGLVWHMLGIMCGFFEWLE